MTNPAGLVCLQGGGEFRPGCEQMDEAVLAAAPGRRVVVLPFAARPGREREVAAANARRWYLARGADAVDAVLDLDGVEPGGLDLTAADVVVLPGGSPSLLLESLLPHRNSLAAVLARGGAVSGASAGAMVLCRWTVRPDRGERPAGSGRTGPAVTPALGLVDVDLVVPHWSGSRSWLSTAASVLPAGSVALGLPERSGVLVSAGGRVAVGVEPFVSLPI